VDDSPVTRDVPEVPSADRRQRGLGPAASMLVLGILIGLGIGWLAWRGTPGSGPAVAAGTSPESSVLVHGVDVGSDPVLGPETAPITIVEFSDFECPFCEKFARETAPALRRQYGDKIRWIFVNNPLQSIHPKAYDLALAGECAHEQGLFWEWYDVMFSGQFGTNDEAVVAAGRAIEVDEARFEACYRNADHAAEVATDLKEAQKFYILGTPTFFVNGQRLEGALPAEVFAEVIDELLGT
jgi:protein-disulfide isomerase